MASVISVRHLRKMEDTQVVSPSFNPYALGVMANNADTSTRVLIYKQGSVLSPYPLAEFSICQGMTPLLDELNAMFVNGFNSDDINRAYFMELTKESVEFTFVVFEKDGTPSFQTLQLYCKLRYAHGVLSAKFKYYQDGICHSYLDAYSLSQLAPSGIIEEKHLARHMGRSIAHLTGAHCIRFR